MEFLCYLLPLLDNTFIGTLTAGSLLALLGLHLYRRQKDLDAGYLRKERMKANAVRLFSQIEIAYNFYENQLNRYDGSSLDLQAVYKILNKRHDDYFHTDSMNKSNVYFKEIEISLNEFVSTLKIEGEKSDEELADLIKLVSNFSMHLVGGTMVLPNCSTEELVLFRTDYLELYKKIKTEIKKLNS